MSKMKLNEAFNSRQLAQIVQQHNGINNGSSNRFALFALQQVTDNNFNDVVKSNGRYYSNPAQNNRLVPITFNDGSQIFLDTSFLNIDSASQQMNGRVEKPVANNSYMPVNPSFNTAMRTKREQNGMAPNMRGNTTLSYDWVRDEHNARRQGMNEITLNEEQLRKVVREAIEQILTESVDEISPEFYAAKADKARRAAKGIKGIFNKGWAARKRNQAERFDDMAYNHPDDTWDAVNQDDGYYSFSHGYEYKKKTPGKEETEYHRLIDPDTGQWTDARGTVNRYKFGGYGGDDKDSEGVVKPGPGKTRDWAFIQHKRPDVKGKSHPRNSGGRNTWRPTYYSQTQR